MTGYERALRGTKIGAAATAMLGVAAAVMLLVNPEAAGFLIGWGVVWALLTLLMLATAWRRRPSRGR